MVHRCGVSAEPEVIEHNIEPNDEFVIMATDGIWDVVDNLQAVSIVAQFIGKSTGGNTSISSSWNAEEASMLLTKFARSRWEKMSPMVDDITAIVVKLRD